ncbi:head GIN domain-containing protein [Rasiella sp. SM2506]|uniref:head GIN domain-containing protein n=1 Tax=Rasiella sp. SM2506 TaxID=3423914 RepID=UPI003D78E2C4
MFATTMNVRLQRITRRAGIAIFPILCFLFFTTNASAQSIVFDVDSFDKIIVSPHIEVIFKEGTNESVSITSNTEPMEKLNIVVENTTLHIYLEDARIVTGSKKEERNGYKRKVDLYKGTVVRAVITYKNINSLDLRGEENFTFENTLKANKLKMSIYGESQVYMNDVAIKNLQVSLYGESFLEITKGSVDTQKITAYGESKVNTANVLNKETKLTAYGDGTFQFNVSEKLKVTSYGEATIIYSGNADLNKGLIIGETKITKVSF